MRKSNSTLLLSVIILSSMFPDIVQASENYEMQVAEEVVTTNQGETEESKTDSFSVEGKDSKANNYKEIVQEKSAIKTMVESSTNQFTANVLNEGIKSPGSDSTIYISGNFGTCEWYITTDHILHVGGGTVNVNDSGSVETIAYWQKYSDNIYKIVLDGNISTSSTFDYLFYGLSNVTEIDGLSYLDISSTKSTRYMFGHMSSLRSLDISSFDTSNVWDMEGMFAGIGVETLDLSTIDSGKVTKINGLVSGSPNLKNINLSSFTRSTVTGASAAFAFCPNLEEIDLSSLDLRVTPDKVGNMFYRTPIRRITLSEKTPLTSTMRLNSPPTNENYTGKWQSQSGWFGTSEELYQRSIEGGIDTYIWQPVATPAGDVTSIYVDTDGNEISEPVIQSGNVGETYETIQKKIEGYTFKEAQGSTIGTFTDDPQKVTYVYTKKPVVGGAITSIYVDTDGSISQNLITNIPSKDKLKAYNLPQTGDKSLPTKTNILLGILFFGLGIVIKVYSLKNEKS